MNCDDDILMCFKFFFNYYYYYTDIQIRNLFNKLVKGYRMEQPKFSNHKMYTVLNDIYLLDNMINLFISIKIFCFVFRYQIMLNCWKSEPSKRPSFTELSRCLGELLQNDTKKVSILRCDSIDEYCYKL